MSAGRSDQNVQKVQLLRLSGYSVLQPGVSEAGTHEACVYGHRIIAHIKAPYTR